MALVFVRLVEASCTFLVCVCEQLIMCIYFSLNKKLSQETGLI